MAGLKRQRVLQEDEEQSLSEADSVSSKRLKHSQKYESEDAAGSDMDEETEQLYASQFYQQQQAKKGQRNTEAENGIIESIDCHNFMCHTYLHVDLGPLINFIIGHNGSGKSAVLTALTICLGGKASATNRGGSLKSFIKEGEDTCTLKVRIRNGGQTGYQRDLYGNIISVERTFNRAGTSNFRLKGANDRIVSTRKADLEEISDYYALQLDNPITVLTQDQARQFLSGASSSDKYKFFIKGVQLEQLYNDYELFAESIAQIEATFEEKRAQVATLLARRDKAKELLDLVGRQRDVRRRINALGMQMAWSQVEEQERTLTRIEDVIKRIEIEMIDAQERAKEAGNQYAEAESTKDQAEEAVQQWQSKKTPIEREKEVSKKKTADAKMEGQSIQDDQRKCQQDLKSCRQKIDKAKADIAEEKRRLEALHGGSHARRIAELEELRRVARVAKADYDEHIGRSSDHRNNREQAELRLNEHKALRAPKAAQIKASEERLGALRERRDMSKVYPANMGHLLKALERDTGFGKKPIGPIANFVHLTEQVWSGILEKSFGGNLNGFIVTNKLDQQRLSNIMRTCHCMVPIFIGSESHFDFSNHEPDHQYQTIHRILKIDHPLVLRQLVINHQIEQIILIEDMNKARDTMMGQRLRNVKACFSLQSGGQGLGERFAYGSDNSVATNYLDIHQGLPRMQADAQDLIRFETETLKKAHSELANHDEHQRELHQEVKSFTQALDQHAKRSKDLKVAYQSAEDSVEDLQNRLDEDKVEEGKLEALNQGLIDEQNNKVYFENTYQEYVIAKDEYAAKRKALLTEMNEIDERLATVDTRIEKARTTRDKADEKRLDALVKKNEAIQAVEQLEGHRNEERERLAEQAEKVQHFTDQAGRIGQRVVIDHGETTESLDRKLQKLVTDSNRFMARIGGDTEKISNDYAAAARAYQTGAEHMVEEERLTVTLKEMYHHRKHRWELFKKYITARARITFSHFLSERSFQGKLTINHRDKLLDIHVRQLDHDRLLRLMLAKVQPDETQRDRQGRQTKTLSGGEKSFSQICFLLAVWEAIGAPIRCLDEFDVFMDSVNREASMKLLIKAARDSIGRQFIFITPQSMASIDATHDIKIIKMRDPERNQGTLSFPTR